MNSFSENERQIRSLADTLPKDLQLTASVWLILRHAPKEHQGKLLHLYETLFRTGAQPTQLLRPDNERAAPPREIPIQNRSVYAIYLFSPCHMYYLLFVVAHTLSQKLGKVQRELLFTRQIIRQLFQFICSDCLIIM